MPNNENINYAEILHDRFSFLISLIFGCFCCSNGILFHILISRDESKILRYIYRTDNLTISLTNQTFNEDILQGMNGFRNFACIYMGINKM